MAKRVDDSSLGLGQTTKEIISNTTARTNKQYAILHALTDVVFNTMTDTTLASGSTTMNGLTLKAGDRYYGNITDVTLTSGTLIAYFG